MATINHIIGAIVAPLQIGMALLVVGILWRRARVWFVAAGLVWLWLFSTNFMSGLLGRSLEICYPRGDASEFPTADLIVILGGGMGVNTNDNLHAEMSAGADRVWRGAELYKAGKAPRIYATGFFVEQSTGKLLEDFGVPREVVVFDSSPQNTEEEGVKVKEFLDQQQFACKPRILLVTSAWHMRRAELMFRHAMGDSVEVIAAPGDFESLTSCGVVSRLSIYSFLPDVNCLGLNSALFKEHYAYWGYKLLRGF